MTLIGKRFLITGGANEDFEFTNITYWFDPGTHLRSLEHLNQFHISRYDLGTICGNASGNRMAQV